MNNNELENELVNEGDGDTVSQTINILEIVSNSNACRFVSGKC